MPDEARRQAIADDPLLAPTLRARTAHVDHKLATLRLQFAFLLALIVGAMVLLTVYFRAQDTQLRYDRYSSCVTRIAEIASFNATLPAGFPPFPAPTCPPDPHAG